MQELNKAIDDIWSKGELSNGITTRYVVPEDAKRLLEIYAPYVENTAITFEYLYLKNKLNYYQSVVDEDKARCDELKNRVNVEL